ncbi:TMEM165.2 family protein [Megaselia abdita]
MPEQPRKMFFLQMSITGLLIISILATTGAEVLPKFDDDDVKPPPILNDEPLRESKIPVLAGVGKEIDADVIDAPNVIVPISNDKEEPKNPIPGEEAPTANTKVTDVTFLHAFVASISVILVSEIGDKTFFIAAIMSMTNPRLIVFGGAILALVIMTILSAVFGIAATIIPRVYTYYISTVLFFIFGLKMLKDGYSMKPTDAQEEMEEVQMDLRKREDEREREAQTSMISEAEGGSSGSRTGQLSRRKNRAAWYIASRIFFQAFTMTFLAEWGDRSQLTTIILGARENVYGVIVGGCLGHAFCTGLAVIGGRLIAQKISVRTVTLIGGVVFLLFAVSSLFFDPNDT